MFRFFFLLPSKYSSRVSAIVVASSLVLLCLSRRHASCYTPATVTAAAAATAPPSFGIIYPVCILCGAGTRDTPLQGNFTSSCHLRRPRNYRGKYPNHFLILPPFSRSVIRRLCAPLTLPRLRIYVSSIRRRSSIRCSTVRFCCFFFSFFFSPPLYRRRRLRGYFVRALFESAIFLSHFRVKKSRGGNRSRRRVRFRVCTPAPF